MPQSLKNPSPMANDSLAEEHLNQAADLISATTVVAIFYTLVFILYCLSFRLSYAQLWDDHGKIKRQMVYTFVLQTVLLICATLDVIVSNQIARVAYIENSSLPGGPLGLSEALDIQTITNLDGVVNIVEDSLILGVLVWRVWVVWSGTRFIIPLTITSVFFYLGNAGFSILSTSMTWNIHSTSLSATPRAQSIIFITTFVFSVTGQVFMTSSIIARLLFVRQQHIKLMGRSDVAGQYLGIATMLVESFALDTLWGVGISISYGLKYAPTLNLFSHSIVQVDILTNFLVVYRVLSGRAWTRQTQERLSTLRWASSGVDTTTSGTVDPRHRSAPAEADLPVISFCHGA